MYFYWGNNTLIYLKKALINFWSIWKKKIFIVSKKLAKFQERPLHDKSYLHYFYCVTHLQCNKNIENFCIFITLTQLLHKLNLMLTKLFFLLTPESINKNNVCLIRWKFGQISIWPTVRRNMNATYIIIPWVGYTIKVINYARDNLVDEQRAASEKPACLLWSQQPGRNIAIIFSRVLNATDVPWMNQKLYEELPTSPQKWFKGLGEPKIHQIFCKIL